MSAMEASKMARTLLAGWTAAKQRKRWFCKQRHMPLPLTGLGSVQIDVEGAEYPFLEAYTTTGAEIPATQMQVTINHMCPDGGCDTCGKA